MAEETQQVVPKQQNASKKDFIFAVGRRKSSVARVRLYESVKDDLLWDTLQVKKGDIVVNKKPIQEYFNTEAMRYLSTEPIRIVNAQNRYTFTIRVAGGGKAGQLTAAVHGISRALCLVDPKFRPVLKKKGFLTRDSRVRERRMVGTGGKARRTKQSPKR